MAQASLTELKAMAYDLISNIEYLKGKLTEVNQKIAKLAEEENENGTDNNNSNN